MGSTHWKYSNEDIAAHLNFYILFSESDHSVVLKEINVPLWQHSVCNAALQSQFGPKYTLPKTAICAGAEGRDACDVRTSRGFFFLRHVFHICRVMEEGLLFVSKMVNGTRLELSASVLDVADKEYQEFTPECRLFNRGWSRQYWAAKNGDGLCGDLYVVIILWCCDGLELLVTSEHCQW